MKIIYTDTGKKELVTFHDRQKRHLEELISAKKFVFGDDTLEITGADVRDVSPRIRPSKSVSLYRFATLRLAATSYVAVGTLIFFAGVFWPYVEALYRDTPRALGISGAGLGIALMGVLMLQMMKIRLKKMEEMEVLSMKSGKVFYGGGELRSDQHLPLLDTTGSGVAAPSEQRAAKDDKSDP